MLLSSPAVVIESGFLTHPEEGMSVLADAHRASIVAALVAAIAAFDKTVPASEEPLVTTR